MTKRLIVFFSIATCLLVGALNAEDLNMGFDGTTDGGWTLVNGADASEAFELMPSTDFAGTVLDGLSFNDITGGVMYYSAPPSLLSGNFTDTTVNFNYQVNSVHAGGPFQFPLNGFDEVFINGIGISGLDIIDESIVDTIQPVTIDFTDPAFANIDLSNISSLWIKAEWWGDDVNPSVESHLLTAGDALPAPEPTAGFLLIGGLFAVGAALRNK